MALPTAPQMAAMMRRTRRAGMERVIDSLLF
jgi:hypothetical protein